MAVATTVLYEVYMDHVAELLDTCETAAAHNLHTRQLQLQEISREREEHFQVNAASQFFFLFSLFCSHINIILYYILYSIPYTCFTCVCVTYRYIRHSAGRLFSALRRVIPSHALTSRLSSPISPPTCQLWSMVKKSKRRASFYKSDKKGLCCPFCPALYYKYKT